MTVAIDVHGLQCNIKYFIVDFIFDKRIFSLCNDIILSLNLE